MSDVATAVQLPMSNTLHYGVVAAGGVSKTSTTTLKRKTPSELRGELLKQKNSLELSDESLSFTSLMRNADGAVSETKKSDSSKAARFTRMDAHYPVTKTCRLLCQKENIEERIPVKCVGSINNSSLASDSNAKIEVQNSRLKGAVGSEGGTRHFNNSSGKCPSNTFKSVQERSLGSGKSHDSSSGKALKGLVSCEYRAAPAPLSEPLHREGNLVPQSLSEIHIPGQKIPLDLTLKTSMHVLSSSSVNCMCLFLLEGNQGKSVTSAHPTCTSRITTHGGFHSWVNPQSSLPHVAISALTSAAGGQLDFVSKRQQAWEDSFRSLYFMLRKKHCELFYVVVMFTGSGGSNKTKRSCHAYVSQSTRNLRSLLKEYDISFSMPLCVSKVEEVSAEDLVELSAIEKNNLGQTRAMGSMRGVDNTPQSLLKFSGKNVHALYDFLLNYGSFYTPLTGNDVPVLYSPVPFENAAPSAPEVRCKQVRRVDHMPSQLKESNVDSEPSRSSSTGICYSVDIKDAYLPPWVISGVSNAMRCNGDDFQDSFVTESTSIGLNAGLDTVTNQSSQRAETDIPLEENDIFFGIPNSTLSLQRHSAFLKGLKYSDTSYTAYLSPID